MGQIPLVIRPAGASGPSGLECGRRRLAVVPRREFASETWPVCKWAGLSVARFKRRNPGASAVPPPVSVLVRMYGVLRACMDVCMTR